jgi:hypothetical protein
VLKDKYRPLCRVATVQIVAPPNTIIYNRLAGYSGSACLAEELDLTVSIKIV